MLFGFYWMADRERNVSKEVSAFLVSLFFGFLCAFFITLVVGSFDLDNYSVVCYGVHCNFDRSHSSAKLAGLELKPLVIGISVPTLHLHGNSHFSWQGHGSKICPVFDRCDFSFRSCFLFVHSLLENRVPLSSCLVVGTARKLQIGDSRDLLFRNGKCKVGGGIANWVDSLDQFGGHWATRGNLPICVFGFSRPRMVYLERIECENLQHKRK